MDGVCGHNPDKEVPLYCRHQFDSITGDIKRIRESLCGNGKPGYNVRIDRLEQERASKTWLERIVIGGVIVMMLNGLWGMVSKISVRLGESHTTSIRSVK